MDTGSRGSPEIPQELPRLASPPILVALVNMEPLLLYIAATNQVVSAVLVVERDAPTDKSKGKRSRNTPGTPKQEENTSLQRF